MDVFLTKEAQKQYLHLTSSDQRKIKKKLSVPSTKPLVGKKLIGQLIGTRSLKAWPYRIIYIINEAKQEIWVVSILHRQGAYK